MPKNERKNMFSKMSQQNNMKIGYGQQMYGSYPLMSNPMILNQFASHPNLQKHIQVPTPYQQKVRSNSQSKTSQKTTQKNEDIPDMNFLKSLEDISFQKDYLGEFIFRKIENHPLSDNNKLTIDEVGRITGMILGIEDINEIYDICVNYNHLSSRIKEALELLSK